MSESNGWKGPSAQQRLNILRRTSNFVATYLLTSTNYDVYFVNPNATQILNRPVYGSLAELPVVPDLVDVFRKSADLPQVLAEVLVAGAATLWLQFGLYDVAVAQQAGAAGLAVVMDRCLKIEHARFHGGLHLSGFNTGVITSRRAR
jgi:uncharacterized protein